VILQQFDSNTHPFVEEPMDYYNLLDFGKSRLMPAAGGEG
jgi:hypothetical protein